MKTGIIVGILVLAIGGGAAIWQSATAAKTPGLHPDEAYFTVKRGTLTVTITENGSLMAKNSEKVNFQGKRGSGKITFLIEEGKQVEAGEVLCKLDTKEMENQLQQLELEIKKIEVDLKSAQTEFEIQKGEGVATIEKARIALDKANMEMEKYCDGDAPKERSKLEIAIKEAETKLNKAKKKYEDSQTLRKEDYISVSELETDKIEHERSVIQLESAERDLELFDEYTYPMTLTDKDTAVADAERGLSNATMRAEATLAQKEVTVRGTEERLNVQKRTLGELREEIEKFTIKAPTPGLVLHGNPQEHWYRERMKLGGDVWGGMTLFTIPDLRVMQVQVSVHEADINKLKDDQAATVTMDTYPGLILKGKITKIAKVAGRQNPWGDDDVKKFPVEITMDERSDLQLKPGISAKAEVFVEQRENVLFIPRQAVFLEEGKHYCFVMDGGQPVRREVQVEINNDNFTQIASGIDEGQQVLLYNPLLGPGGKGTEEKTEENKSAPAQPATPPAGVPVAAGP